MRRTTWLVIPFVLASTVAMAKSHRGSKHAAARIEEDADDDEDQREREDADDEDTDRRRPAGDDEQATRDDDQQVEENVLEAPRPKKQPRKKAHNEFYFRAGMAHVDPRIQSGGLELHPEGISRLATPMEPVAGGIKSETTNIVAGVVGFAPAVFGGYIAFETLVGIPKTTKLRAQGDLANKSLAPTALDLVPTGIPPLGEEIGEAHAIPPTVTAVIRTPELGPLRFYVGGGASVLIVRDAKITNKVLTEVATPKLEISPSFGVVAQAGIDIHIVNRFYARLDIKELWFQPTETRISNIKVHTTIPLLEVVDVGSASSTAKANPVIVQAGIGATF
jgi:outer membrane protein W